jgi:hypothetical protein
MVIITLNILKGTLRIFPSKSTECTFSKVEKLLSLRHKHYMVIETIIMPRYTTLVIYITIIYKKQGPLTASFKDFDDRNNSNFLEEEG